MRAPRLALAVLREVRDLGITHIDTADVYGPHVANELIREALQPYGPLLVATKVGAVRDEQGGWPPAREPDQLRRQVEDNLKTLGVDRLDLSTCASATPPGRSPARSPGPSRRSSSCSGRASSGTSA